MIRPGGPLVWIRLAGAVCWLEATRTRFRHQPGETKNSSKDFNRSCRLDNLQLTIHRQRSFSRRVLVGTAEACASIVPEDRGVAEAALSRVSQTNAAAAGGGEKVIFTVKPKLDGVGGRVLFYLLRSGFFRVPLESTGKPLRVMVLPQPRRNAGPRLCSGGFKAASLVENYQNKTA